MYSTYKNSWQARFYLRYKTKTLFWTQYLTYFEHNNMIIEKLRYFRIINWWILISRHIISHCLLGSAFFITFFLSWEFSFEINFRSVLSVPVCLHSLVEIYYFFLISANDGYDFDVILSRTHERHRVIGISRENFREPARRIRA